MIQNTGVLIICVVTWFHQAMGESQVTGYVGHSVILKSGLNAPQELLRIQWSIYSNTTYIVTFDKGQNKTTNAKFWRYQGRLSLNQSSGDLEIKNLTADDSMKYTVSLRFNNSPRYQHHVFLTVQEYLTKPNITVQFNSLDKEHCVIALKCSSLEDNVTHSWTPEDGFSEPFLSNSGELWTSVKVNRTVTFNCTATDGKRTASDHHTLACSEVIPTPQPRPDPKPDGPVRSRQRPGCIASLVILVIVQAVLLFKVSGPTDAALGSAALTTNTPTNEPALPSNPHTPTNEPALSPHPHTPTTEPALPSNPHTPTTEPALSPHPHTPTSEPALSPHPHTPTSEPALSPLHHTPTNEPALSPVLNTPTKEPALTPHPHNPTSEPALSPHPHTPTSEPALSPHPHTPNSEPALSTDPNTPTNEPALSPHPHTPTSEPVLSPCPHNPTNKRVLLPPEEGVKQHQRADSHL